MASALAYNGGMTTTNDITGTGPGELTIEDLELSVRAYNCLRREGILRVDQLRKLTEEQLLDIRNFGQNCIDEVKLKLDALGMSLKTFPPTGWVLEETLHIYRFDELTVTVASTGGGTIFKGREIELTPAEMQGLCEIARRVTAARADVSDPPGDVSDPPGDVSE
jgi:Bacterial RNA polymerase, alpha chain C terminal domain